MPTIRNVGWKKPEKTPNVSDSGAQPAACDDDPEF